MPESEAEKILKEEREKGARGEESYWLTLQSAKKSATTTIQITIKTRESLKELKLAKKEPWDNVITRLIHDNKEKDQRIAALEQKLKEKEGESL